MRRKYLLPMAMMGLLLGGLSGKEAWLAAHPQGSTAESLPAEAGVVVSGITISAGPNGETFVDITTSKAGSFRVTELENPRRLVVDFDGARKGIRRNMFPAGSSLMTGVRLGQFQLHPAVVRVVADLLGDPQFDVHAQPGGVRIELKARGTVTSQVRPSEKPEVAKGSAPGVNRTASTAKPDTIAALPLSSLAETTLPGPSASEQAPASLKPAPALHPESMRSEHAAKVLAGSLTPEEQGQAGGAAAAPEQPKYTGEPISVNLKDVDLKDFFRLIHEISGLNIIIDPNVSGTVTMVLDDVPWDQALDIVLKNNNLGKVLEGNVLRIAKVETLTAEQEANVKLEQAKIDAQPLVTKFLPVNYAKAATIKTLLSQWGAGAGGGGALSKRGTVLVDDRTNTLIVSDIASQIPLITDVVAKLDTKTKQVSIEARVVDATTLFEKDLSSALQGAILFGKTTGTGATTGPASTTVANAPVGGPPSVVGSFPSGLGFGVWGVSTATAHYAINAVLAADETNNRAKIISSPTIVTQDNTAGKVIQGVEVPVTTTVNNTVTTQLFQASLQMSVTPHVTQDGNIFLVIDVNNASLVGVTSAGPTINQQQATTQVLVPDGGTVIIGGVKVDNTFYNAEYVPWLGQVPLLGRLFKSTKNHQDTVDLLFFVTPKILPG
jgi:type IV pilus assembly protein PilQ